MVIADLFKEEEKSGWSLRKHVLWCLNNNLVWEGACIGERGSSKSWSMISLLWACAEEDSRRFNVSNIFWDVPSLIKKLDEGVPKKSLLLLDEAGWGFGRGISAREFYSDTNKMFTYLNESIRVLGCGICVVATSLGLFDINIRKSLSNVIVMLPRSYKGYGFCEVRFVEVNKLTGAIEYPFPLNRGVPVKPNYKIGEKHNYFIPAPPKFLTDEYEKRKLAMVKQLVAEFDVKAEASKVGYQRHIYQLIEGFITEHPEILNFKNRKDSVRYCIYSLVKEGIADRYSGINRKVVEDVIAVNFLHKEKKLREPEYLKTLYEKLGSYRKVGDAVGYSHSYVRNLIRGKENGL